MLCTTTRMLKKYFPIPLPKMFNICIKYSIYLTSALFILSCLLNCYMTLEHDSLQWRLVLQAVMLGLAVLSSLQAFKYYNRTVRDSLTGLYGREHFMDVLDRHLRTRSDVFVLMMDLDRFKLINDTLGHAAGDTLLKAVAQKFREILRSGDVIARLGGDEFAVIIDSTTMKKGEGIRSTISLICERIGKAFEEQVRINEYQVDVGVSIGIASFPHDGRTVSDVMRCADVAMYMAKRTKSGYLFYERDTDLNSIESLVLTGQIKTALLEDQFVMYYQPKKNLRTGKVESVEALIRWNHPTLGVLMPDKLIPLCEHSCLMHEITNWVIKSVLAQKRKWQARGIDLQVAINISATDLINPKFLPTLTEVLKDDEFRPSDIVLEITETAVLSDMATASEISATLSALGIMLSIDDYGIGHANLNYLRHLNIHQIKLDKSFVLNITANSQDYNIVQSTIRFAHELGYEVVAEGVETRATFDLLKALDCDIIQGFYVSKPVSAARIDDGYLQRIAELT